MICLYDSHINKCENSFNISHEYKVFEVKQKSKGTERKEKEKNIKKKR